MPGQAARVALVSDTHGVLDGRIAELVAGCDLAVHAGDIGAAAVLAGLRPRTGRVVAVAGNNDLPAKWPAADLDRLADLPQSLSLGLPGGELRVIHGHQAPARGRHDWLRRCFPEARAIVYGHSHHLVLDTDREPWVLNPGAAGRSRTFGGPSCLILTAGRRGWGLEQYRFEPPFRPAGPPVGAATSDCSVNI
jgi:putative phosphoesterase